MSKFTIIVNNSQVERFILNMLNRLKNDPKIEFKKEGDNYVITSTGEDEHLMLAGKPMSWDELISDIATSEAEYERGNFLTSKELKDDVKKW